MLFDSRHCIEKKQFINLLCGTDEMKIGRGLKSCTADVKVSKAKIFNDRPVCFIDTPGFDDTKKSDAEILKTVSSFLADM